MSGGDDDHLTSIMCEEGYNVHVISLDPCYSNVRTQMNALDKVLKLLTSPSVISANSGTGPCTTTGNVAIICSEMSCISALRHLTEFVMPQGLYSSPTTSLAHRSLDIGAVVLLDPPPMSSLLTSSGRRRLLRRYTTALQSENDFRSILAQSGKNVHELYSEYITWYSECRKSKLYQCLTALHTAEDTNIDNGDDGNDDGENKEDRDWFDLHDADWDFVDNDYMKEVRLMEIESSKKTKRSDEKDLAWNLKTKQNKRKRKKGLAYPIYTKYNKSNMNSIDDAPSNDESVDDMVKDLIGACPPRKLYYLGDAMKDRLLVIDTGRICLLQDSTGNEDDGDCWGPKAMEEVAAVCNALPLITLHNNNNKTGSSSDNDHNSSNDDDDDFDFYINRSTHHNIAKILSNWFLLLQG